MNKEEVEKKYNELAETLIHSDYGKVDKKIELECTFYAWLYYQMATPRGWLYMEGYRW